MRFSDEFTQGAEGVGPASAPGAGSSRAGTSDANSSWAGTSGPGSSRAGTSGPGASRAGTSGPGASRAGTSGANSWRADTSSPGSSRAGSSWHDPLWTEAPDWTEIPYSGAFSGQIWEGREDLSTAGPWGIVELSPTSALRSLTDAVDTLERLNELQCWADAQKVRLVDRIRELYEHEIDRDNEGEANSGTKADEDEYVVSLAAEEVGALLRLPSRAAKTLVEQSRLLMHCHELTLSSMESGKLSWRHATTIMEECVGVPADSAARFEQDLVDTAEQSTVPKLTRQARGLRELLHPEAAPVRKTRAVADRRVVLEPGSDGMAWLSAYLPAEQAGGIYNRLDAGARGLQAPDESRTLTQLRADVFTDLLTHTCAGDIYPSTGFRGISATVHITVPALTLLKQMPGAAGNGPAGFDAGGNEAGESASNDGPPNEDLNGAAPTGHRSAGDRHEYAVLEGYGPIDPETAARLAGHAPSFLRILTHPETGAALSIGRVTYRPPKHLQDWVRVRDKTCRHPGCNRAAMATELDHTVPWHKGGHTDHDNLACLCKKHHMLKTKEHWDYMQPEAGIITAMAPSGKTYTTQPPPF